MESFDKLLQKVTSLTGDVAKAEAGNDSARTRLRVGMQDVKQLAQNVREKILEDRRATPTTQQSDPTTKGGK